MSFTSDMNLHSPSGYAMPFELPESSPLNIILGYGKQVHPKTNEEFFHHGVDFMVGKDTWLKALASGVVSGIGSDVKRGFNITVTRIIHRGQMVPMMSYIPISIILFAILERA